MFYLITGGSGSGKSRLAEQMAADIRARLFPDCELVYIATMFPYNDSETCDRIKKHRDMRDKYNFKTIECYRNIEQLELKNKTVALVECMSNLLANEMYQGEHFSEEEIDSYIVKPLIEISRRVSAVVIVTNEVFSDGRVWDGYSAKSAQYISLLGGINSKLAAFADCVIESVCGIPLFIKGERQC